MVEMVEMIIKLKFCYKLFIDATTYDKIVSVACKS